MTVSQCLARFGQVQRVECTIDRTPFYCIRPKVRSYRPAHYTRWPTPVLHKPHHHLVWYAQQLHGADRYIMRTVSFIPGLR